MLDTYIAKLYLRPYRWQRTSDLRVDNHQVIHVPGVHSSDAAVKAEQVMYWFHGERWAVAYHVMGPSNQEEVE